MTQRKPPSTPPEHRTERQIREAQERGDLKDLPGAGQTLPGLDQPHDEHAWGRRLLERKKLSVAPATRQLQEEVETAVDRIRGATSETTVRRIVAEINGKIGAASARDASSPPTDLAPLDPDDIVAQWRASRS